MRLLLVVLFALTAAVSAPAVLAHAAPATGSLAPQPLFRDPIHDGAADPIVVWNPHVQRWWMFYTNRRANVPGLSGVAWVHGCKIGIAESADGAQWTYLGLADIALPPEIGGTAPTLWAPAIVTTPPIQSNPIGYFSPSPPAAGGTPAAPSNPIGGADSGAGAASAAVVHHMFLTVVPGEFETWQHPRILVHLTSTDLRTWRHATALTLASDRVIDACVFPLPGGGWRLWYNNERDRKSIYFADSPDLFTWTDKGKCSGVGERPGEGPFVFRWKGAYWMLVDLWKGLGVYRSDDLVTWTAQPDNLLGVPGRGPDDGVNGGHPGVLVSGDRAYLFYFTHPGRVGTLHSQDKDSREFRRSSIQVVELVEHDGALACDRDAPTHLLLSPPQA